MTEEETTNTDGDEGTAAGAGSKTPKTNGQRALSNLRAAKRSLQAIDWQADPRAQHLVAEANVLALLDLADAIRASNKS